MMPDCFTSDCFYDEPFKLEQVWLDEELQAQLKSELSKVWVISSVLVSLQWLLCSSRWPLLCGSVWLGVRLTSHGSGRGAAAVNLWTCRCHQSVRLRSLEGVGGVTGGHRCWRHTSSGGCEPDWEQRHWLGEVESDSGTSGCCNRQFCLQSCEQGRWRWGEKLGAQECGGPWRPGLHEDKNSLASQSTSI